MSHPPLNPPSPLGVAEDLHADSEAFAPLLSDAFARAWAMPDAPAGAAALHDRLLDRAAASRRAEQGLVTVRRRKLAALTLAPGVKAEQLYAARPGAALRPGEPLRARLIELADAALLTPDLLGTGWPDEPGRYPPCDREWLVVHGKVWLGETLLSTRDYHRSPPGQALPTWRADGPVLLFLRESVDSAPAEPAEMACTLRDADAGWPDFAPGIQRRGAVAARRPCRAAVPGPGRCPGALAPAWP